MQTLFLGLTKTSTLLDWIRRQSVGLTARPAPSLVPLCRHTVAGCSVQSFQHLVPTETFIWETLQEMAPMRDRCSVTTERPAALLTYSFRLVQEDCCEPAASFSTA